MEVVCSHCQARLKIPDEKVPETGFVTANCPKCRSKIRIEKSRSDPEAPVFQEMPDLDAAFSEEDSEYRDDDPFFPGLL